MTTKSLPKVTNEISLRKSGYTIRENDQKRHNSLKKASREHGTLTVLKKLNLVRNYNKNKKAEAILSRDVNYVSDMYRQVKRTGSVPKRVIKIKSKTNSSNKVSKKSSKIDKRKLSKTVSKRNRSTNKTARKPISKK